MCCDGLGLQSPSWTSSGEVLNPDRSVISRGQGDGCIRYFSRERADGAERVQSFLSHAFQPKGFCYKDVVQPFIASDWLRSRPGVKVLKIRPNVTHVAFAMLQRGWSYPTFAAERKGSAETQMLEGLLAAARAIERVPGEAVAYDDLVSNPGVLRAALRRLYPWRLVKAMEFEPGFEQAKASVLSRRSDVTYQRLDQLVRQMA